MTMTSSDKRPSILLCVFLLLISGCATSSDFLFSIPVKDEKYQVSWDQIVKVERDEIVIRLCSGNTLMLAAGTAIAPFIGSQLRYDEPVYSYTYYGQDWGGDYKNPSYYYVELVVEPKQSGFSFNPNEIYLVREGEKQVKVEQYIVPQEEIRVRAAGLGDLLPAETLERYRDSHQTTDRFYNLEVGKKTGFAVRFNVPPPRPGDSFDIEVKGLQYNGKPFEVPIIRYRGSKIHKVG